MAVDDVLAPEWIAATTKERKEDPPKPEDLLASGGLRCDVATHTDFADRIIRAVYGKTRCSPSSGTTLFEDLISPSQEAFALLLYKNGYENWVWMHNHACLTSDGSESAVGGENAEDEHCPKYKFTKRSGDFTSRNGGWTREGKTLFNELCKRVKEDRQTDRGAFAKVHRAHRACLHGKKRKRRMVDGAQHHITTSNDPEDLWSAAATETCAI